MVKKKEQEKNKEASSVSVNTGGGAYIGGDVNTSGGDFIGRNKSVIKGDRGLVIGGDVMSSNTLISGDGNVTSFNKDVSNLFTPVYDAVEKSNLSKMEKADLEAEVKDIEQEIRKSPHSDEAFLMRRLRNIRRLAPDILDVIVATIANPAAGFGVAAKKIAEIE